MRTFVETLALPATYTKLRSGGWGARVTKSTPGLLADHDILTVTKRSGETKAERVERVLWQDDASAIVSLVPHYLAEYRSIEGEVAFHTAPKTLAPELVAEAAANDAVSLIDALLDGSATLPSVPAPTLKVETLRAVPAAAPKAPARRRKAAPKAPAKAAPVGCRTCAILGDLCVACRAADARSAAE